MSDKPFMDDAQRWATIEEHIRRLRLPRGHLETKTIAVGGVEIVDGLEIPDVHVAVDPLEDNPETKYLLGFRGVVRTGAASLEWDMIHNGVTYNIASDGIGGANEAHDVTTTPNEFPLMLDVQVEIEDDTWFRCTPNFAEDGTYTLSAVILMLTVSH